MKVTDHIKEEHKEIEELFEQFEEKPQMTIVKKIYDLIYPHHQAEEEVVFPTVAKKSKQKKEVVQYMMAEHDLIHLQLEEILKMKVSDELFEAKVSVLKEIVDHHLTEEEDAFFKHAEEVYTESQLEKATPKFEKATKEYQDSKKTTKK